MIRHFCREKGIEPVGWTLARNRAVISFGSYPEEGGTRITAKGNGLATSFFIPFGDPSSVENCCHCFVAALNTGIDPEELGIRFRRLVPLSMRLEIRKGMNNSLLLNDYYNSDINSLGIALDVLNRQAEKDHLRKTVILSDIRQSGLPGHGLYAQVSRLLEDAGVQNVFGIGKEISEASSLFTQEKHFFASTAEFITKMKPAQFSHSAVLIKGARDFRFEEISEMLQQKVHRTVLEINLDALVGNLNAYRSLLSPDTKIMVMVKAFSYGSGDVEIAKLLQHHRVDSLAVAVADEGKELRQAGISLPVLVMNPEVHSFRQMIDYQLEPNLYSAGLAREFARAVDLHALPLFPVHLKIDTGLNRLGIKSDEEIGQMIELFVRNPQLRLQTVFSHLAASDNPSFDEFTLTQIRRFEEVCSRISSSLGYPVVRHILNSAGIERFNGFRFEMVRLGIGLYGVGCGCLPLKAIGRLKSVVSQIREVVPGETVGYNRTGKILKNARIAVLPVGYADGLDRRLGNGTGRIFINGNYAPYVGNICMDMCMADVTEIDCKPGDEAEIFGENVTVSEMAGAAGTIPYEILTGISQRVRRVYIQE
jgi:alanine racemase